MLGDFFRKYGWQYIPGILFLVLSSVLQTQSPRLLGEIIDALSVAQIDRNLVYKLTLFTVLVAVGVFVTRYIWRYLINGNGRNLEALARQRLFTHFQEMGVHFYSYRKTGDLMAYAINDINAIRQTFGPAIAMLVNGISTAALSIGNMTSGVNPRLALFALLPVPIIVLVMFFMGREVRSRFRRVQEVFASISDRVQENISGLRVIKAYVQEDAEVERFEELNRASRDSNMRMVKVSASMSPSVDLLFGISFTISLIYGSYLIQQGAISVGDFVAFNGYLTLIRMPVRSIARIINVFSRGMASLKRYNALMEVPPMITDGAGDVSEDVNHADVRVDHLSFQYPEDSRMALSDISFHLEPGKTLGILGRTGSGKTTLVNLLVRLFNVPDGCIKIGGVDINQFTLDQLRRPIGYVPQDNFLFSASIEENVRFFSDEFSQADVEEATSMASIHDNIAEFPAGYHTEVGERGMSLSGGQKQRICIARALITKPDLLILDDSLSAVDAQTEAAILGNIREQTKRGGSAILIAHRISALAGCDEIIVLDQGRILERGNHQQLMEMGGLYASIASDQMLSEEDVEGGDAQ